MKRLGLIASVGALLALVVAPVAYASGVWWGWSLIGGASYCVSYSAYPATATTPNVAPTPSNCNGTAAAGPSTFTGYEAVPADLFGPLYTSLQQNGPSEGYVSILQMRQGAFTKNTATGNQTIPFGTQWWWENATTTNPTITLPASPIQGQTVSIVLGANLTTGITTAASGSASCVPACGAISGTTAGTTYTWVYNASDTSWYRIQ